MERELKTPKQVEQHWDICFAEQIVCAHCGQTITEFCADHGLIRAPANKWVAGICQGHMLRCAAAKVAENSANPR